MSIVSILLILIGIPTLYRGIINKINLEKTICGWNTNIYLGAYIDAEIDIKDLMQTLAHSPFKKDELIPISNYHGVISPECTYLINKEYQGKQYIPLIVSGSKLDEFQEYVLNNQGKYQIQGKIIQLKQRRYYGIVMSVTGLTTPEEVDQIVNTEYAIKLIDFHAEREVLYIGIVLIITGIILFLPAIEEKKSFTFKSLGL